MIKKYTFRNDHIEFDFDDSKTVRELIEYAFDRFDYYEPAGMEIVTVFQYYHSGSYNGWFTRDPGRTCAQEIENPDALCFAYQMPDVFFFAEGGRGHHMSELGNHPVINDPVQIKLRFEDFENTIVINGKYTFRDILKYLKKTGYIPDGQRTVRVKPVGTAFSYELSETHSFMNMKLTDFEKSIDEYTDQLFPDHGCIYHNIFEII